MAVYDTIGTGYATARRADPRIAARLLDALGDAGTVLDVGAGTGSYEPRDRHVAAVEPSQVMLAQRPAEAAPAVRAAAEALPFRDDAFDAAMAVLTVHHWSDKHRGLTEVRRVTRGRIVMFTGFVRELNTSWWLHDYFPAMRGLVGGRVVPPETYAAVLGPGEVIPVPIPADCTDGFEAAYWRRPEAVLDPARWQASSAFTMIGDADRAEGMARLAADLDSREWHRRYGHLLDLDELDLGYRILIAKGKK
ncbi:MAG TPA: class I SAM-dependent methyltransferase [Streptosporangiaceae bacterium]|nr:class I SAM-dependent methyltransferase [Streptosporangiaceae bacterium]